MQPILPSWFKQRQGKAELAGENTFRLTAPNVGEAFIHIQRDSNGNWSAHLRQTADGPDLEASAPDFNSPVEAWEAAFEYYRTALVI
jgi:hypothetical protein